MRSSSKFISLVKLLSTGLVGGLIFVYFNMPIPWTLGPLMATILVKQFHDDFYFPPLLRSISLIFAGIMLGTTFTQESATKIIQDLPLMFLTTAATIMMSIFLAYTTTKILPDTNITTAVLGNMPGGITQMVLMASEIKECNLNLVVFMQTFRLLSVITIVPFVVTKGFATAGVDLPTAVTATNFTLQGLGLSILVATIGALIAKKVKLPNPFMIGPLLTFAALAFSGVFFNKLPNLLVIITQVTIGAYFGMMIDFHENLPWKKIVPMMVFNVILLISFGFFLAYMLYLYDAIDLMSAFLALAPGGVSEMGITALILHGDTVSVLSYQLFRLLFIIFLTPGIIRWWINYRHKKLLAKV